jgi:hypothetical protein
MAGEIFLEKGLLVVTSIIKKGIQKLPKNLILWNLHVIRTTIGKALEMGLTGKCSWLL